MPDVTTACGRNGVRALTVITSGLGAEGVGLLAMCRRYGMRLAGPNWGPVETTAAVTTDSFRACQEAVAADDPVDAVLAVASPGCPPTHTRKMPAARLAMRPATEPGANGSKAVSLS